MTFEINSIFLSIIFIRLKSKIKKDWIDINLELLNIFVKDLNYSIRLFWVSDMNLGKYV